MWVTNETATELKMLMLIVINSATVSAEKYAPHKRYHINEIWFIHDKLMIHYFTVEIMAGATSREGSAYCLWNTWRNLLLEVHVYHMYEFYRVIVSTRISALVDDFGVVYFGFLTTLW